MMNLPLSSAKVPHTTHEGKGDRPRTPVPPPRHPRHALFGGGQRVTTQEFDNFSIIVTLQPHQPLLIKGSSHKQQGHHNMSSWTCPSFVIAWWPTYTAGEGGTGGYNALCAVRASWVVLTLVVGYNRGGANDVPPAEWTGPPNNGAAGLRPAAWDAVPPPLPACRVNNASVSAAVFCGNYCVIVL